MKINTLLKKSGVPLLVITTLFLTTSCTNNQTLFAENGDDWGAYGDAKWEYANGELVGTVNEGEGFVMTQQKYSDFVLELEFKPDDTVNSGVFLRCTDSDDISEVDCHEINISDLHANQDFRTGSIVKKAVPLVKVDTNNKWNTYKIKAEKNRIEVWVNDVLTADLTDDSLIEGYIALQAKDTGEIRFRNVKLQPL